MKKRRFPVTGISFRFVITLLVFFLSSLPLCAQSWNKAVFRDDEIKPRDFDFNSEYFLNLLSYRPTADWRDRWDQTERGYFLTVGSVRSREFYLHQEVKMHLDVSEKVKFNYDLIEDEDYDTRYLRHRVAVGYSFLEDWRVYALGEGTAIKEDGDMGVGILYQPGPHNLWEVQVTAVDYTEDKGLQDRHFTMNPWALLVKNEIPISEDLYVGSVVSLQLPMTLLEPAENLEFHFRKSLYEAYLRWRTGDESEVRLFVSGEKSKKYAQYSSVDPDDQKLKRRAIEAGGEFTAWWDTPVPADYWMGFTFFNFRERDLRPEDVVENEKQERDEFTVYGGVTCEMWEEIFFKPALYVDYVSRNNLFANDPWRNDRYNGIQSKLSLAVEFRFGKKVRLVINPNLDLDQMNWGGGNLQFVAVF